MFRAATEAQRATDYILGLNPDDAAPPALPDSNGDENAVEDPNDGQFFPQTRGAVAEGRMCAVKGAGSTHGAWHLVANAGMQAFRLAARCRVAQGLHQGSPSIASISRPLYQVLVKAEF